jgi:hypothetical protein
VRRASLPRRRARASAAPRRRHSGRSAHCEACWRRCRLAVSVTASCESSKPLPALSPLPWTAWLARCLPHSHCAAIPTPRRSALPLRAPSAPLGFCPPLASPLRAACSRLQR